MPPSTRSEWAGRNTYWTSTSISMILGGGPEDADVVPDRAREVIAATETRGQAQGTIAPMMIKLTIKMTTVPLQRLTMNVISRLLDKQHKKWPPRL